MLESEQLKLKYLTSHMHGDTCNLHRRLSRFLLIRNNIKTDGSKPGSKQRRLSLTFLPLNSQQTELSSNIFKVPHNLQNKAMRLTQITTYEADTRMEKITAKYLHFRLIIHKFRRKTAYFRAPFREIRKSAVMRMFCD